MDAMKKNATAIVCLILVLIITSCSQGAAPSEKNSSDNSPSASAEPVNLVLYNDAGIISENFDEYFLPKLKEKLPNILIQYLASGKGQMIQDLVTAGTVPDVLLMGNGKYTDYYTLQVLTDLNPLIKEQKVDLNRFEDGIMDYIRGITDKGETFALPFTRNGAVVFYNKDIFDKFSVPYPRDGMTWDDMYELAKKMTRTDGNVQYRGFDMNYGFMIPYNQLSIPVLDSRTDKGQLNNDGWKQIFDNFKRFYEIPGNELTANTPSERDAFTKDRNLAMRAGNIYINAMREIDESSNPMRWDMVTLPTFKEAPNTGISFNGHFLAISATSKYKTQAFEVIKEMVSDDFQRMRSEETTEGLVLKNAGIKQSAGKNIPSFSKVNLQAVTKLKIAKSTGITEFDNKAFGIVTKKFQEYARGGKDVNTILRETNDEINTMVSTEKTK